MLRCREWLCLCCCYWTRFLLHFFSREEGGGGGGGGRVTLGKVTLPACHWIQFNWIFNASSVTATGFSLSVDNLFLTSLFFYFFSSSFISKLWNCEKKAEIVLSISFFDVLTILNFFTFLNFFWIFLKISIFRFFWKFQFFDFLKISVFRYFENYLINIKLNHAIKHNKMN